MIGQASTNILCCQHFWLSRWRYPNLWAPYYRIYWNRNPGALVQFGGREYALEPESILLVPPFTAFGCSLVGRPEQPGHEGGVLEGGEGFHVPENSVHHFVIEFTLQPGQSVPPPGVYSLPCTKGWRKHILKLGGGFHEPLQTLEATRINYLIYHVLNHLPEASWKRALHDSRILRATAHIEQHIAGDLRNSILAALCGMSPSGFARLFRAESGFSVQYYVQRRRIELARSLLTTTALSVEEVAERCGFCDRHYFSRCFSKHTGAGPATYRRQAG